MNWFDKLKRFAPLSRRTVAPVEPEHVTRERNLTFAYDQFVEMSGRHGIREVRFADGGAVITLDDGRRYNFDMHDPVARLYTVPYTGSFEAKETEFLRRRVGPGMVCVDAGGSFGWYAVLLSRLVGAEGKVYSFEPLPANFKQLQANVVLNGCGNVQPECCALAEAAGMRELFLPDIGVSGSFALHEYRERFARVPCRTITLDQYCQENAVQKIDFIKADIEGAEWLLLKGGEQVIKRDRPMLFMEIQAHSTRLFGHEPEDVFGWLKEREYTPHRVDRDGSLLPVTDPAGPLPDYNFIFVAGAGAGAAA